MQQRRAGPNPVNALAKSISRRAIPVHIIRSDCSLFVLDKAPAVPSRVLGAWQGFTLPSGFGGMASAALLDQHETGRAARLGGKLEPSAHGQREGSCGLGDDKGDGGAAQGLFGGPEQVGLVAGLDQVQPLGQALGQCGGQQAILVMGEGDPEDRPGRARGLEQGKRGAPAPLGLVDTGAQQREGILRFGKMSVREGLHGSARRLGRALSAGVIGRGAVPAGLSACAAADPERRRTPQES